MKKMAENKGQAGANSRSVRENESSEAFMVNADKTPEITPEMIEAGLIELYSFSREDDLAEDAVERIFRSMLAAAPKARRGA